MALRATSVLSRRPTLSLISLLSLSLAPFLTGCGDAPDGSVSAGPPAAEIANFEYPGVYDVTGVTRVDGSEIKRRISGKIVITAEGDRYHSAFSLSTNLATPEGERAADLNGTGEGVREGDHLSGSSETQMILSLSPGLDPKFGFLPSTFGPRIQSTWSATPKDRDRLRVEIATVGAPGEDYQATRTTLLAVRTAGATALRNPELPGTTPDVAAEPPR